MRATGLIAVFAAATLAIAAAVAGQTRVFTTSTPEELDRARDLARTHLLDMANTLGIDPKDLTITGVQIDQLAMAHVRVRQSFRGIPVIGGDAIVHLRSTGEISGDTNSLVSGVNVDTQPRLPMADAVARAIDDSHCSRCTTTAPTADLAIVRQDGKDYLVYRVQLRGVDDGVRPTMPVVLVDAHDGHIVQHYDNLQTGKTPNVR